MDSSAFFYLISYLREDHLAFALKFNQLAAGESFQFELK